MKNKKILLIISIIVLFCILSATIIGLLLKQKWPFYLVLLLSIFSFITNIISIINRKRNKK